MVSNSIYGIRVYSFSNNNELTDNRVSNNKFGIHLSNSIENTLTGNIVFNCARTGINLLDSTGNILYGNRIVMNSEYGLYLLSSGYSSIYNNYLINKNDAYSGGANMGTSLNINKAVGTNLLAGSYPGLNFWAAPWEKVSTNQEWIDKEGIYDETNILSQ
jgi:parallel beta-helix repeat protein